MTVPPIRKLSDAAWQKLVEPSSRPAELMVATYARYSADEHGHEGDERMVTVTLLDGNGRPRLFGRIAPERSGHAAAIAREAHALAHAARHKAERVSVPGVEQFSLVGYCSDWQTWLPGERLDALMRRGLAPRRLLEASVAVIDSAHRCTIGLSGTAAEQITQAWPLLAALEAESHHTASAIVYRWTEILARAEHIPLVAHQHGDLWPGNVLLDGDRAGILDWERSGTVETGATDLFQFALGLALEACGSTVRDVELSALASVLAGGGRYGDTIRSVVRDGLAFWGLDPDGTDELFAICLVAIALQFWQLADRREIPWQTRAYLRIAASVCRGEMGFGNGAAFVHHPPAAAAAVLPGRTLAQPARPGWKRLAAHAVLRTPWPEICVRRARDCAAAILAYHRILPAPGPEFPFDDEVVSATPEEFARELGWLRKNFDVISLAEMAHGLEGRHALPDRPALVTFDDGYVDNYEIALPILREQGLSAAFFLATGFVGTARIPWWDQVACCFKHSRLRELPSPFGPDDPPYATHRQARAASIRRFLARLKAGRWDDAERALERLRESTGVDPTDYESTPLFMCWDQARRMAAAGMELGAHTCNHPVLGRISDPATIRAEVEGSRDDLRCKAGVQPLAFTYPVGIGTAMSELADEVIASAGFHLSFSYEHGYAKLAGARWRLPRIHAEHGDDFGAFRLEMARAPQRGALASAAVHTQRRDERKAA